MDGTATAGHHEDSGMPYTCAETEAWLNSDAATIDCATGQAHYGAACCSLCYSHFSHPDQACGLWLDAGHTCSTTWADVCTTHHPWGAYYNLQPLSFTGCTQCDPCGDGVCDVDAWENYIHEGQGHGCYDTLCQYTLPDTCHWVRSLL